VKTFDRYVLGKTVLPLAMAIGIALFALLLERMVRLLDLVVNKGGPFYLLLQMLANLIPHYLGIALPAAFFIGVLHAVMKMSSDSELDAMQAFGGGLQRLLVPIMGLAVTLMVLSAIIVGFLQPYTRYAYRALVYTVTHTAWDTALERGTFFTGFGNKTIVVDGISQGGRQLSGIFIHEETPPEGSITTTAQQGRIYRDRDDLRLILNLERGVRVEAGRESGRSDVLTFDSFALPLDVVLDSTPFRGRGERERELTLFELWPLLRAPPEGMTEATIGAEIHDRLVRIATILVLPLFAIPLGLASRRRRRGIGMAIGIIVVVLYHHLLRFGASLATLDQVSPWIGLWLPFLLFAAASAWGFYATSTRPGVNPAAVALERLEGLLTALGPRRLRARGAA
jgi:lipopolysaccharide export system permease protein